MESTLIRIVLSSISQFAIVHVVFAAAIALDDANDDEKKDEEGESENHADEPTGGSDAVVPLWHHNDIYDF